MSFADNLQKMPSIAHIAELQLIDHAGHVAASIPNQPGKAGSARLYHALFMKHGRIHVAAAQEGLELFAEHTTEALQHPGSHPNIDRLFAIIESGTGYEVRVIATA